MMRAVCILSALFGFIFLVGMKVTNDIQFGIVSILFIIASFEARRIDWEEHHE